MSQLFANNPHATKKYANLTDVVWCFGFCKPLEQMEIICKDQMTLIKAIIHIAVIFFWYDLYFHIYPKRLVLVMLDFIWMGFAPIQGTQSKRKLQNENVECNSNPQPSDPQTVSLKLDHNNF